VIIDEEITSIESPPPTVQSSHAPHRLPPYPPVPSLRRHTHQHSIKPTEEHTDELSASPADLLARFSSSARSISSNADNTAPEPVEDMCVVRMCAGHSSSGIDDAVNALRRLCTEALYADSDSSYRSYTHTAQPDMQHSKEKGSNTQRIVFDIQAIICSPSSAGGTGSSGTTNPPIVLSRTFPAGS